jgi:hypothetical protein
MGDFMAFYITVTLLVIGGLIGWCGFFYTISHLFASREREIELIREIRIELERVKADVVNIKINR